MTAIALLLIIVLFFFFQAEDGIRDLTVTGVSDVCSSDLRGRTARTRPSPVRERCPESPARIHPAGRRARRPRSEEHTSELQSQSNLVCRLLLEKKQHRARGDRPGELAGRHAIVPRPDSTL